MISIFKYAYVLSENILDYAIPILASWHFSGLQTQARTSHHFASKVSFFILLPSHNAICCRAMNLWLNAFMRQWIVKRPHSVALVLTRKCALYLPITIQLYFEALAASVFLITSKCSGFSVLNFYHFASKPELGESHCMA